MGRLKFLILIFLLIIVAGTIFGLLYTRVWNPSWNPFGLGYEEKSLINYQRYSNEKFDFEVNYPQDWTVKEQKISSSKKRRGAIYEVKFESPELKELGRAYIATRIVIYNNLNDLPLEQWINRYFESVNYQPIQEQKLKTSNSNIEAIEVIAQLIGKLKYVFFSKDKLIYEVEFLYPIENQPYSQQANMIFDRFLDSLIIGKAKLEELKESDLISTILYTEGPLSFLYPQYWIKVSNRVIDKSLEMQGEENAKSILYLIHPKEKVLFTVTQEKFSPQKISFREYIKNDIEKAKKEGIRIENLEVKSDEATAEIYFKDNEGKEVYSRSLAKLYDLSWDESRVYSISVSMDPTLRSRYKDFTERIMASFKVSQIK